MIGLVEFNSFSSCLYPQLSDDILQTYPRLYQLLETFTVMSSCAIQSYLLK